MTPLAASYTQRQASGGNVLLHGSPQRLRSLPSRITGGEAVMPKPVMYIAGKDPLWEVGGGHSSYVRAHCRAAIRAGYEPHLFCTSEADGVVQTDYGFVHRF